MGMCAARESNLGLTRLARCLHAQGAAFFMSCAAATRVLRCGCATSASALHCNVTCFDVAMKRNISARN
jgi:hypothetical protein